jgi:DNA polymerase-4
MAHRAESRRIVTADPGTVDDSACTILHVDMDAFYAMVEMRRRPELRGRTMMVAGTGGRGVVLSASYEARRHGVRSAMPTSRALLLCPGIEVVPPDMPAYAEASRAVMALFADVTPLVEQLSVDEAFLDVSGAGRTIGRPAVIAQLLRSRIRRELDLVATVGAASTKFVAKLASGLAKPDGLLIVPPADVLGLLHPLPVRALWGVGPRTAERLERLGITTVAQVAELDLATLIGVVGAAAGTKLHELAWGRDPRAVTTEVAEASVGAETTFAADSGDAEYLARELLALSDRTARRARSAAVRGRTVSIKVRFEDFSTVSRSATLDAATDLSRTIYATATDLLARARSGAAGGRRIRLLGVRLENLAAAQETVQQLQLGDGEPRAGWREAEGAVDRAVARFGAAAIRPAALLGKPKRSHPGPGEGESFRDFPTR